MGLMEKTYAVIVAIETYPQLGDRWKLQGIVAQSAKFASWLVNDREMPPDHIQIFQSEGDIQPFISLGIPENQCQHANAESLNQFFPNIGNIDNWNNGGLLLIYWIGHGFVSQSGERRLILSDAIENSKTNLDVDQLIQLLRSNLAGRFTQQFAFIDTCARFFESLQSAEHLPDGGLSTGKQQIKGITQNFYFAASSGEYAKNMTFGPQVLQLLKSLPKDTWPPDGRYLRNEIETLFDKLLTEGMARQQPSWLEYRDGLDNKSSIGVVPTLDDIQTICQRTNFPLLSMRKLAAFAGKCKTLAEKTNRDRFYQELKTAKPFYRPDESENDFMLDLLRLVAGVIEQDKMKDFLAKLIELESNSDEVYQFEILANNVMTVKEFWPLLVNIPLPLDRGLACYKLAGRLIDQTEVPTSIEEILDSLLDRDDKEPLVEFLARVGLNFENDTHHRKLLDWLKHKSEWTKEWERVSSRLENESNAVLYLLIEVGGPENELRVKRAWLWQSCDKTPFELEPIDENGNLGSDLASLLDEVMAESKGRKVQIELIAPEELLNLERGRLECKDSKLCQSLDPEHRHPVVLRLRDRMMAKPRDRTYRSGYWKNSNTAIRERLKVKRDVFWLNNNYSIDTLSRNYDEGLCGELIGIPFVPINDSLSELLSIIYSLGIPYACWPRHTSVDLPAAKNTFQQLIGQHRFDELPNALCSCRCIDKHPLLDFLLLWDDPMRNPYDLKYIDTAQGGQN